MSKHEKLFTAIQTDQVEFLQKYICDNFSDSSWKNISHKKSGDNLLHYAAKGGHMNSLKFLTREGLDPELGNFDAKRPLHEAAQSGHVDCVRCLLDNGVLVDALKRADWTPLMLACTKSNYEVVRELVSRKAKIHLKNKDGWTAFHIACREGHLEILNFLLDCDCQLWDTISKNGRTPLHTAALHGHLGATQVLLRRGAYDRDNQDSCGFTPFMDAIRAGHHTVADCLIQMHNVNVLATDVLGRQAIHLAAQAGCLESVTYLIKNGLADINTASTISRVTPLHLAAKECQVDTLELLLSLGADVHTTDHKGRTALHLAAGSQSEGCVRILLKHGAINVGDSSGVTPDSLARQQTLKHLILHSEI